MRKVFLVTGDEIENSCQQIKPCISFSFKESFETMMIKTLNFYRADSGFNNKTCE